MKDVILPRVTAVEPLEGFRLQLTFTDGLVREVDLSDDLWGQMAEPLQDPAYFRQVRVDPDLGTVVWPNGYDLDPTCFTAITSPSQDPPRALHGRDLLGGYGSTSPPMPPPGVEHGSTA